jgi:hypothetical protein
VADAPNFLRLCEGPLDATAEPLPPSAPWAGSVRTTRPEITTGAGAQLRHCGRPVRLTLRKTPATGPKRYADDPAAFKFPEMKWRSVPVAIALFGLLVVVGATVSWFTFSSSEPAAGSHIAPGPPAAVSPPAEAQRKATAASRPAGAQRDALPEVVPKNVLQPAEVVWNTPANMTMGQSSEVELRVTLDPNLFAGLQGRITAPGKTTAENVELSRHLTASLESTVFDIDPKGPQPQQVLKGQDAQWTWVISPKSPGRDTLLLSIVSDIEGGPQISSLVRQIDVSVTPYARATDFIVKNWDKLLTLLIFPAAAWAWQRHRKRRSTTPEAPLPPLPPED